MSNAEFPEPPDEQHHPKQPKHRNFFSLGLLMAGIGCVVFCSCIGLIVVGIMVYGVQKVRVTGDTWQTANNLKQCALGTHMAHDTNKVIVHPKIRQRGAAAQTSFL
jgi:hypothetical protein